MYGGVGVLCGKSVVCVGVVDVYVFLRCKSCIMCEFVYVCECVCLVFLTRNWAEDVCS